MAGVERRLKYDFLEPPSKTLECSICMCIFHKPHLVSCCGNHFCEGCIDKIALEGRNCPLCNQPEFTILLDRGLERTVKSLKIFCVNNDHGCTWMGELGKLEDHLYPNGKLDRDCKFEVVECSQGCGENLQRRFMRKHQTKSCICRPYVCDYCEYGSIYEDVRHNHWPVCPNYPMQCPNKCELKTITRSQLEKHLMEECPLEKVECEFSYAGCKAKVKRRDMPCHMSENQLQHLSQMSAVNISLLQSMQGKDEQVKQLKRENQTLKKDIAQLKSMHTKEKKDLEKKMSRLETQLNPVVPVSFTMHNFEQHKNDSDRWFSPMFYSFQGGYRMCIRVDANGISIGKGSHLSVLVHLAPGQHDHLLKWPFKGSVTIQLLNQRGISNHHEITIPFNGTTPEETTCRVKGGTMATWGWGCYTFIPHDDLKYNSETNCEYLINNCLQFTVIKVELHRL